MNHSWLMGVSVMIVASSARIRFEGHLQLISLIDGNGITGLQLTTRLDDNSFGISKKHFDGNRLKFQFTPMIVAVVIPPFFLGVVVLQSFKDKGIHSIIDNRRNREWEMPIDDFYRDGNVNPLSRLVSPGAKHIAVSVECLGQHVVLQRDVKPKGL